MFKLEFYVITPFSIFVVNRIVQYDGAVHMGHKNNRICTLFDFKDIKLPEDIGISCTAILPSNNFEEVVH